MLNPMFDAWASFCGVNPFSWDLSPPATRTTSGRQQGGNAEPSLISERLVTDAGSLEYKLFVPRSYTGQPCPLLVMLHGCSQDAQDFARGTGMNAIAEKYQCIVAYPEQSSSANSGKCWNWFERAHHHRGGGEPALIAGVARKVMHEYAIDPEHVFIAGLSAGAAMAVVLGRTYPDLFAAVGCHSGLAYGCAVGTSAAMQAMQYGESAGAFHDNDTAPTMIVFHGDMDGTVHPRNGQVVIQQWLGAGSPGSGAQARLETGQIGKRSFTREIHRGAGGAVVAEHWTIHGGGHAWSGGRPGGSYTAAGGPDASEEMMRFFLESGVPAAP